MQEQYNIGGLIKITGIILAVILVFYGLTIFITNNRKNNLSNNTSNNNTQINYDEILIGSIYNQKEEEYYVLAELSSDYLTLSRLVSSYSSKEDSLKVYVADLNDGLNKQYVKEQSNFEQEYPIFSKSTLLKISNKKIVEYVEGIEEIQKKLG